MYPNDTKVAIIKNEGMDYCREPPFHPHERYPEYPFSETGRKNDPYRAFRKLLFQLGMDEDNYGKAYWDPFGEIISPGDHVLIKPNLVCHNNPCGGAEEMITHGSIIRAALDYTYLALKGTGSITIADAPDQTADFGEIIKVTGLDRIAGYYAQKGISIKVLDLRKEKGHQRKIGGRKKEVLMGDPLGYSTVDLKESSELSGISHSIDKFRVADYDTHEMVKHHGDNKHEFCISNSVLDADVIINLPKLKTHGKTGMTCALKNLVGINGYKDWLPHYRMGSVEEGGDEYFHRESRKRAFQALNERMNATDNLLYIVPLRLSSLLVYYSKLALPFRDDILNGSCRANDTIPRTISDLNKIAFHADKAGKLKEGPQRRMLVIVDGVVGGEKEGPMRPSPRKSGVLVAGHNPVAVDLVCSRVMGFDYRKMPVFKYAMNAKKYALFQGTADGIEIMSDDCKRFQDVNAAFNCHFVPAMGWKNFIEYIEPADNKPERLTVPA